MYTKDLDKEADPNSVGVIFFPAYDWGISSTHPEREERLLYTHDQLREEGVFDLKGLREFKPKTATDKDMARAHFCPPSFDNVLTAPHYISAGSTLTAADLVLTGKKSKAFALTRPPGHHAMRVVQGSRGFCTINIEAVMVEYIRQKYGIKRIAIVDTDCHHGDGTQDVYWHDPDLLFISIHQDGRTLYPGSGFPYELGGPKALGTTLNIPLPPNTGDEGYLYAMENLVRPVLDRWKPELIINSAGQDNHFTDPITNMSLTAQGYGNLIKSLNPDISVLEGGYAIRGALPYVNLAVLLAMADMDYSYVMEPDLDKFNVSTSKKTMDYIKKLCDALNGLMQAPEEMEHDYKKKDGWWTRTRDIYYDTDGIREHQHEKLYACDNCPGTLLIKTSTGGRFSSLAIGVPRNPCQECQDIADENYEKACREDKTVEFYNPNTDEYKRNQ